MLLLFLLVFFSLLRLYVLARLQRIGRLKEEQEQEKEQEKEKEKEKENKRKRSPTLYGGFSWMRE